MMMYPSPSPQPAGLNQPPSSITVEKPEIAVVLDMPIPDLINRFVLGVERFDGRILRLRDDQLDMAFLPDAGVGRWPVRVLMGHLADAELAFAHRLRRVAAEENPTFSAWDENAFIDAGLYGREGVPKDHLTPVGAYLATIFTLRKWLAPWLRTLPEETFNRKGLHPVRGEQTMKTILAFYTWHLEHHAWFLNEKVKRLA